MINLSFKLAMRSKVKWEQI